jgi:hypothetical protein
MIDILANFKEISQEQEMTVDQEFTSPIYYDVLFSPHFYFSVCVLACVCLHANAYAYTCSWGEWRGREVFDLKFTK